MNNKQFINKNFKFYSIIVRKETGRQIQYDWFLIPSDFPAPK